MDIVGENIRRIRLSKGLLQKELAYHAQMNPSNLSKLERGEYTWTKANLERIAKALNVSLAAFFVEASKVQSLAAAKGTAASENARSLGIIEAKLDRILLVLGEPRLRA